MEELPLQLSQASGVPYYRQIVDQVGQLIRSGQLTTGTRLPSVRDLSGQLLVSLITTRRAYADLEGFGLIVRRQGYGTYVAEEIEMASHEKAIEAVQHSLGEVVREARRLGLGEREIGDLFSKLMGEGVDDGKC